MIEYLRKYLILKLMNGQGIYYPPIKVNNRTAQCKFPESVKEWNEWVSKMEFYRGTADLTPTDLGPTRWDERTQQWMH